MKILIIDDSATVRIEVADAFSGSEFETLEASDGPSALDIFKNHPDVGFVICDYNMPGMNGLETLESLFNSQGGKSIPSLMLTTETSRELKEKGKAIGVVAWIIKPFDKNALLNVVNHILGRKVGA